VTCAQTPDPTKPTDSAQSSKERNVDFLKNVEQLAFRIPSPTDQNVEFSKIVEQQATKPRITPGSPIPAVTIRGQTTPKSRKSRIPRYPNEQKRGNAAVHIW